MTVESDPELDRESGPMIAKLLELGQLEAETGSRWNDRFIRRELGISDTTLRRWRARLKKYPDLRLEVEPEEVPRGRSETARLRREWILGSRVVTRGLGVEVSWDPRNPTDRSPWVDSAGLRYSGYELRVEQARSDP